MSVLDSRLSKLDDPRDGADRLLLLRREVARQGIELVSKSEVQREAVGESELVLDEAIHRKGVEDAGRCPQPALPHLCRRHIEQQLFQVHPPVVPGGRHLPHVIHEVLADVSAELEQVAFRLPRDVVHELQDVRLSTRHCDRRDGQRDLGYLDHRQVFGGWHRPAG